MPPKKRPVLSVEEKERIAAQLLAASEGLFSTATAMKLVNLKSPQRDESRKKRVWRNSKKVLVTGLDNASTVSVNSTGGSTPRQLVMGQDPTSQHSISSLSAPPLQLHNNVHQPIPNSRR